MHAIERLSSWFALAPALVMVLGSSVALFVACSLKRDSRLGWARVAYGLVVGAVLVLCVARYLGLTGEGSPIIPQDRRLRIQFVGYYLRPGAVFRITGGQSQTPL